MGTPLTKEAIYHEIITTNAGALIARMEKQTGILFSDWAARYSQIRDGKTDQILGMEHAEETLRSLQNKGIAHYIFTHRGHSTFAILDRLGLRAFFQDIITKENGFPLKPAPDALNYLIEKHGLNRAECIMLGDRDIDLDSGKNAGMACALFDPDHYYDDYDTPHRYTSMFALMADLVWEGAPADLSVSDLLTLQDMQQAAHPEWGGIGPEMGDSKMLWLVSELGEVIDVMKKVSIDHLMEPGVPRSRLVEELADVAMYFHDVLQCYGISAKEFSQAFYGKMRRNLRRDYAGENKQRYGK
jgi:HAD superfamily hydrolase (TIGR01549 family)